MYTKFCLFSPAISYIFGIFLVYISYNEIQQIVCYIEITCLKGHFVT